MNIKSSGKQANISETPNSETEKDLKSVMIAVKIIKRYANRKLYDTDKSCYVTLEEISVMIKNGEDIRVIDNKSQEDLTALTLAQIIVEQEKKDSKTPLKLLKGIIQSSNGTLGDFYQKHFADPARHIKEDASKKVGDLFTKKDSQKISTEPTNHVTTASEKEQSKDMQKEHPVADHSIRAFVTATGGAFENMQKSIDEGIKEALGKMSHLHLVRGEHERLRKKLKTLDGRIRNLDERLKKKENWQPNPKPSDHL